MTVTDDIRLRGRTRWSSAAKCPRQCAYGLLGATPAEPDERTKRLWRRGRQLGADLANDFAAKYGEENVVREKAVPWPDNGLPLGELHTDVWVRTEKLAVEVKSSTSPASILDDAITQLGGEIRWDEEAEVGCLAIVDPTGWREPELLPVFLTDELTERVENIAAQVVTAAKGGPLPERVCKNPSEGRGKFCAFIDVCFADWQAPDPLDLSGDVAQLAVDLKQAQDEERVAKQAAAEKETRRKELAAQLSEWNLLPGMDYLGEGVKLRRTKVDDSPRFSYSKASKAGVFSQPLWTPEHEALIAPFVSLSGGHDRWKVELLSEQAPKPSGEDYGDVPWDDADLEEKLGG